jgi:hypothetical protein
MVSSRFQIIVQDPGNKSYEVEKVIDLKKKIAQLSLLQDKSPKE